jgi:hypothetical protein
MLSIYLYKPTQYIVDTMTPPLNITAKKESLEDLKLRLEAKATKQTAELLQTSVRMLPTALFNNNNNNTTTNNATKTPENMIAEGVSSIVQNMPVNSIINIMKEGEAEFVKNTGRYMTYSEMRQMYG